MYLLQNKTGEEVLNCFREYHAWAEKVTRQQLTTLRTDGGGEYINNSMANYLSSHGIERQITTAYTSHQNGVAERSHRLIFDTARSMLHHANLSSYFWPEAAQTAVFIRNRCPTRTLLPQITPYEAFHGQPPSLVQFRVFGCIAHMHIPAEVRANKLADRSKPCINVGYSTESQAYRLYDPASNTIIISKDVHFDEEHFIGSNHPLARQGIGEGEEVSTVIPDAISPASSSTGSSPLQSAASFSPVSSSSHASSVAIGKHDDIEMEEEEEKERIDTGLGDDISEVNDEEKYNDADYVDSSSHTGSRQLNQLPPSTVLQINRSQHNDTPSTEPPFRRSNRGGGHPSSRAIDAEKRYQDSMQLALWTAAEEDVQQLLDDPMTYKEAMKRTDGHKWEAAMRDELDSIHRNHTWDLVKMPAGRAAINSGWVLKRKRDAKGNVIRYKARLVAKGYSQQKGIDYTETFAPVAKFSSIRLLLALAAHHDWDIHQMDVKTAFLHGDLDVEIYMRQPEDFVEVGKEEMVCLLKKSLYGLKQASRAWNQKINNALILLHFTRLESDHCIYVRRQEDELVLIALYVDDLLLISNTTTALATLKKALTRRFEMTDLGEAQYILGLELTRNRTARTLSLSQFEYVRRVVERYGMENCKHQPTPMATKTKLLSSDSSTSTINSSTTLNGYTYASVVGALMYAAMGTRPDLAFAISTLSKYNNNPTPPHWSALKRVLRYLAGTKQHTLTYGLTAASGSQGLTGTQVFGYCDSDWGSSLEDRRSVTGWVFMLAGGAISWQSQRQKSVALSTVEAEYMAACLAAKEAIWLRSLLKGLGFGPTGPINIYSDSQGAMALAKNPEQHQRSKHIDIRYHFLRDQVLQENIQLVYTPTAEMAADQLTKPLTREAHNRCIRAMGLHR